MSEEGNQCWDGASTAYLLSSQMRKARHRRAFNFYHYIHYGKFEQLTLNFSKDDYALDTEESIWCN